MALTARTAIIACSLAALMAGPALAQKKAASDDPVVARVNGAEIRRSEVINAQKHLPPQYQQAKLEQIYPQLIDRMVADLLVLQAAKKQKLENDPEVKKMQEQVVEQAYLDRVVRKGISEQKLHELYDKYVKDAPPHEEVHASHILVQSEDEAKAVIAQLQKGGDFAAIAKEKSIDPAGKNSGGDLGWFTKDQMVPEFADAAFKLKKGEITSAPVKSQFGYHVIKLEDRRTATAPNFDQVKPQLQQELARQLANDHVAELGRTGKIEVFMLDGTKPQSAPNLSAAPPQGAPVAQAGAPVPGAPTLSPATAPDQLKAKP
jgi:peptidyl-prolyl cis-trans isomerase C